MDEVFLLIGELFVDVTLATSTAPLKLRLGGIAHAARALWACSIPYAVAAACPTYLVKEAESFLKAHGCTEFFQIAVVNGAPNVILISDPKETGNQGYEDILRDTRTAESTPAIEQLGKYRDIAIFPGSYSLPDVARHIHPESRVTVDVAYDIKSIDELEPLSSNISAIAISTSSELFVSLGADDVNELTRAVSRITPRLLLKESRGGSRLFSNGGSQSEEVYASLHTTANSIGVGDAYTAVFASLSRSSPEDAVWRAMQVATRYAQTTFPDDFKTNVVRDFGLQVHEVRDLGGVFLPWHDRPKFSIYLAAPDFSYTNRSQIDLALAALKYHNFSVRRPIVENGEAERGSAAPALRQFYDKDVELLRQCSLVFAIPLRRDPGTLIEIGMAIQMGIPVITFDPHQENNNTMVLCGSNNYSVELDVCISATFEQLSKQRAKAQ